MPGKRWRRVGPESVTVTYDGDVLGTAPLRPQGGDCVVTLPSTSRGGPGRHEVRIAGTSVATTYTVDPPPFGRAWRVPDGCPRSLP
jgi:hypothetical protein